MTFTGTMTVAPGAVMTVTNTDPSSPHTLTATGSAAGKFDTGNIDSGKSATFTAPTAPGHYAFVCQYHPFMTGTLVVV